MSFATAIQSGTAGQPQQQPSQTTNGTGAGGVGVRAPGKSAAPQGAEGQQRSRVDEILQSEVCFFVDSVDRLSFL